MNDGIISERLRELVLDENKIVTYKYLSKVCSIHVNIAKRVLEQFLNSEGTLNATYFLSGFIKQGNDPKNDGYLVAVVPSEKLDKVKGTFSKLDSCHVYSVQRTVIKDSGVLYSSNDASEISGKERLKPVIQNENLEHSRPTQVVKSTASKQPVKMEVIKQTNVPTSGDSEEPESKDVKTLHKPVPTIKTTGKGKGSQTNKKAGIMAAFARGDVTKKKSPTSVSKENAKPSLEDVVKKESSSNGSKVPKENDIKHKNGHSGTNKKFKTIEKQMWSSSESSSEEDVTPPPRKRSKTLNRIKQLPESDSDNEEEGHSKETPISSSEEPISSGAHIMSDEDDENVIPPTPDQELSRQYVTVTKTYEDEGGFLVTRKERELEEVPLSKTSPSGLPKQSPKRTLSDENVKKMHSAPSSRSTTKGKSKSAPASGKKQASLMSFFTKK